LANLIDNAIAHSPPDKSVRVDAGAYGRHVTVRVIDRGPGLKKEDRERVFEPFQRGAGRGGDGVQAGGVGLGLAVAKGFIETMGGRLVLTETPGGGLTAILTLPVAG
jgi:two-component system sensor histidine kinase KdpD